MNVQIAQTAPTETIILATFKGWGSLPLPRKDEWICLEESRTFKIRDVEWTFKTGRAPRVTVWVQ